MKLFKRKLSASEAKSQKQKERDWRKVFFTASIAVLVVVVIGASSGFVIHQSNTNPQMCAICHVMQPNVQSYLTGKNLDASHAKAGVECKQCHDYPLSAEIKSGVNYLIGNYYMDGNKLPKRKYDDAMCLKCHISRTHIANATDYLRVNPHLSHWGDQACSDCHVSHGAQINYCSQCHDNGGQRMVGGEIFPRAENPWVDPNKERPDANSATSGGDGRRLGFPAPLLAVPIR